MLFFFFFFKEELLLWASLQAGFEPSLAGSRSKHPQDLCTGLAQMCRYGTPSSKLVVPFLGGRGVLELPKN